jgi:hypothetical protein
MVGREVIGLLRFWKVLVVRVVLSRRRRLDMMIYPMIERGRGSRLQ